MRRKILAIRPTWLVDIGGVGRFRIRRRLFALGRKYDTIGGPYDGTNLTGSLLDLTFHIAQGSRDIARSTGRILSLRDIHAVEVVGDRNSDEIFAVMMMLAVQLDRRQESNERHHSD